MCTNGKSIFACGQIFRHTDRARVAQMAKERNKFVDIIRGVAMLLVVLGHTMTGCTTGAENTLLFNIVWSIQMPLFILISGYVTRYSRNPENASELGKYVLRRTLAYILPWAVWSFLIRGLIFGNRLFLDIEYLLWHMDSGYWFLTTIWVISLLFGLSHFVASKIAKMPGVKQQLLTFVFYAAGMGFLAGIGFAAGFSFFAIKLTLYYMPFYFAGYLYGQYRDKIQAGPRGQLVTDIVIAVCLAAWVVILTRFNLYTAYDVGLSIVIRVAGSLTGCIVVCGFLKGVFCDCDKTNVVGSFFRYCGEHSLEIYIVHNLVLYMLRLSPVPDVTSIQGVGLIAINYLITISVTLICVRLLNTSRTLKLVLFGKMK